MPEPTSREYAAGVGLLIVLLAGAAVASTRPLLILVAATSLALLAVVPALLWQAQGYPLREGWLAGFVCWPLAVAFGLWGPHATRERTNARPPREG